MIKQFSLLLVVGLMLTPSVRTEIDLPDEEPAEGGEGEVDVDAVEGKEPEEEIELEEAKEEDEGEKMKDLDTVVKEAKEGVEKLDDGPEKTRSVAMWVKRKITGYKVIYGTKRVYRKCGCQAKPDTSTWEEFLKKIEGITKWTEEMVLVCTTTNGYKYIYKASTDMHYIKYYTYKRGGWQEKRKISIADDFEKYLGISVIQWIQNSSKLYGIVRGSTVIAFGLIEELPYVLNRLWVNYLVSLVMQRGNKIQTYKVTWKGRQYRSWTDDVGYMTQPYFLPEKNRKILFITVYEGHEIKVIPKPPDYHVIIPTWPRVSIEWPSGFKSLPPDLLPPVDSVESGIRSGIDPEPLTCPSDSCEPITTEHFPEEQNGKSCSCQKKCVCSYNRGGSPYRGGKVKNAKKSKKERKKRSAVNSSYSEFVGLTKDCVTERKCRRAYTKFLNNGVIRLKEE